MFNLSGSEIIFLVVIALVVLGPDKLPEAMRKAGKFYADFKKMTNGFQNEMKSVLEEPMRELRETADLAKRSTMWDSTTDKPVSGRMADHTPSKPTVAQPTASSTARPAAGAQPPSTAISGATASVAADEAAPPATVDNPEIRDAPAASGNFTVVPATPIDASSIDPRLADHAGAGDVAVAAQLAPAVAAAEPSTSASVAAGVASEDAE